MGIERRATDRAPTRYRPRRPSQSVLYRCVQQHLETWLAQCRDAHADEGSVPEHVEREFRRYLECGILAHGFARARCGQCGHDLLIAFSCKGRGVCPSCNARRMVANAAHLTDPERLLYTSTKPGPGGDGSLLLTPLELIDRIATLVPPPRVHRHRYFGVLSHPTHRCALRSPRSRRPRPPPPPAPNAQPATEPAYRRAARCTWALLLARIYEVFPLGCPICGGAMRIIAFITDGPTVRDILGHLGEPTAPPRIAPARGPPLWDLPDARAGTFDPRAQPAPEYAFDQRLPW